MDAESIQETLKNFNFATTYAIMMKLTAYIFLNKSFIWQKRNILYSFGV